MDNFLSAAAADRLASHPAVADAARFTAYPLELDGIATLLSGTDLALMHARSDLPWVTPPREPAIWQAERNAGLALVSEAFVERFGKKPGDTLRLPTPSGVRPVVIAGVFADYGNERGSILVDRTHLKAWFADARVTNVSEGPGGLSWSPDGKQLAFAMFVPGEGKSFASMPAAPDGAKWAAKPIVIDRLNYRGDGQGYAEQGHTHV
ncbi:MAG: hypothetical protein CFE26_27365, partial [Verrucomicrobiales bacterium VVV1]